MDSKEFIKVKLDSLNISIPDEVIEDEMESVGIELDSDRSDVEKRKFDLFLYNVVPLVLMRAESVSEGQYSISYSTEALTAFYRMLARRLGLPDTLGDKPEIRDISDRW